MVSMVSSPTLPFYSVVLSKDEVPFSQSSFAKGIKTWSVSLYSLCERHSHPRENSIAFYNYTLNRVQSVPRSPVCIAAYPPAPPHSTAGGTLQGDF